MPKPTISLIIPIYNVEKFLPQTLGSIKKQTWKDFEAICINDGSTDGSLGIIKKFVSDDKRFKLIDKPNGGVSSARNEGLKAAQGKYIMFLDGDDYLHPQAMAIALEAIKRSKAEVCLFGYQETQVGEKVKIHKIKNEYTITQINKPIMKYLHRYPLPYIMVWDKIYKAKLAKSINFYPIHPGEDDVYSLEIFLKTKKFTVIEPKLVYYVQHPQSKMHSMTEDEHIQNRIVVKKYFRQILKEFINTQSESELGKTIITDKINIEKRILKDLLIKPLRSGAAKATLAENYKKYQQRIKDEECYLPALKLKHKILLKLMEGRHYTLARILMWF